MINLLENATIIIPEEWMKDEIACEATNDPVGHEIGQALAEFKITYRCEVCDVFNKLYCGPCKNQTIEREKIWGHFSHEEYKKSVCKATAYLLSIHPI